MENETKKNPCGILAGILCVILAVRQLTYISSGFSFWSLLWLLAYATAAGVFFLKKRKSYAVVPFALLAVLQLRAFIISFNSPAYLYLVYSYYSDDHLSACIAFFYFLVVVAYLGVLLLATLNFTSVLQDYKEKANSLWFVPAVLVAVKIALELIYYVFSEHFGLVPWRYVTPNVSTVISNIFTAATFALSALWIAYPDGLPKGETTYQSSDNAGANVQTANVTKTTNDAYCGLVKHILLLLFTFGIWHCIWIYKMTGYTNAVQDEKPRTPTNKLLLCLFVPFYLIYWIYKTAQRIDKMAAAKGISSDMSTLCLILEIFVPIIPPILLQDKMNNIVTAGNAQSATIQSAPSGSAATIGTAEELKNYKELLDNGVITQEEFDAKKKQLLGLE